MGIGDGRAVGVHLLMDFYGVSPDILADADALCRALQSAACAAGMTPLSAPVAHAFAPRPGERLGGVTAFLPLAESHIALHTYPEHGYLAADIFTCGMDSDAPERARRVLENAVMPARSVVRRCVRGAEAM